MEILKFYPCQEAIDYRKQFDSFEDAWNACERGDWMMWIAKRLNVDLRILTRAKALCAITVRKHMKDERSINACIVALRFSKGKATRGELDAATDAAYAAYADDAAYAAYADDADAAYASAIAAIAIDADAGATDSSYAAYDAAYARKKSLKKSSDICREVLTESVLEKVKQL